jgi:hypothetical protein
MPIPAALAQALDRTAGRFNPAVERQEYVRNKELYELYLDLLEADIPKIQAMIEKHHDDEAEEKVALRKKWAVVLNLVPTVVGMVQGYVFAEEPVADAKGDPDIEAFLEDCDGNGRPFAEYVRTRALPLGLVLGHVDALVQNPLLNGEEPTTRAEEIDAGVRPALFTVTPLQRINWSTRVNGSYNWMCFRDADNENPDPFARNVPPATAYITVSAANRQVDEKGDNAFWIRSWKPEQKPGGDGQPTAAASEGEKKGGWEHLADYAPTKRCPVATFMYRESIDPRTRHTGVSKIALIAQLTKAIIQVMSWSLEDVLANLALLAIPTKGGRKPVDEEGNEQIQELTASSALYFDKDSAKPPFVLQGSAEHITVKLTIVELFVREILRLANLLGASAEAEQVSSGVQGVVMRSELFQELSGVATGLDNFALEVLALVKSWASNADVTAAELAEKGIGLKHWKGPYALDPIADVIANASAVVQMFRDISPVMVEQAYKQTARAFLYSGDPKLQEIIKDIEKNTGAILSEQKEREDLNADAEIKIKEAAANPEGEGFGGETPKAAA